MVLSMDRWVGTVAVVTGANSGIGAAIVERLVQEKLKVVGLDKNTDNMQKFADYLPTNIKGSFHPLKCDITKEKEVTELFKFISENIGPGAILVNSAGIIGNTNLVEGDAEIWREIFDVNVIGLCITTREAVKNMRANDIAGHIIHINSIGGHRVPYFPVSNVYPASKHAVTALTETLRMELNSFESKIKITSISPGLVCTDIIKVFPPDHFISNIFTEHPSLKPEDVADAVHYALSTPPHVQVHDMIIKVLNEKY